MEGKSAWVITTVLYFLIGIIAMMFVWVSIVVRPNFILFMASTAAMLVAFDNMNCTDRKTCYTKPKKQK